ncbi:MAG: sialate O-acetylesterase [Bacteroides sp.]|nr:sialate O-acetylesterase [Bacteroides sp.]
MKPLRKILYTAALCLGFTLISGNYLSARTEYWEQKVTLFNELRITPEDIVFLGNSITDGGEFAELFCNENIKNRGISGDVISGVMERLHQVTSGSPRKIFLLIGINDISHDIPAEKLAEEYNKLVKKILADSPSSQLYIQSVMPINNDFGRYKNLKGKENVVNELNTYLQQIAVDNNVVFIDLSPILADANGKLKRPYTNDGLHLTGRGYRAWTDHIRHFVEE